MYSRPCARHYARSSGQSGQAAALTELPFMGAGSKTLSDSEGGQGHNFK